MQLLWQQHVQEEDWGFLLIDARNSFNGENRTVMMWAVQLKWPSVVWFEFNCYRHWANLVIKECDGTGHFLHSKEWATQGDTLYMIIYILGILSLILYLRMPQTDINHPWYADETRAGNNFSRI